MTGRRLDWRKDTTDDYEKHTDGTPHRADRDTVQVSPDYRSREGGFVTFDVWCADCGLSGAFSIDVSIPAEEVQWT